MKLAKPNLTEPNITEPKNIPETVPSGLHFTLLCLGPNKSYLRPHPHERQKTCIFIKMCNFSKKCTFFVSRVDEA